MSEITVSASGGSPVTVDVTGGTAAVTVTQMGGDRGPKGDTGPANSLTIGTVTTGAPGSTAVAVITGTAPSQVISFTIPRGDVGQQGAQGPAGASGASGSVGATGPAGPPNSLTIGSVVTLAAGSSAVATITGTSPNQVLSLSIPRGDAGASGSDGATGSVGATGPAGPANSLTIGTVTTGVTAAATITGTAPNQTLSLVLPKGDKGDTGDTGGVGATGSVGATGPAGPANSLSIGTVTTGTTASATITGTAPSQTLSLVLQRGEKGDKGDTGPSGGVSIGLVLALS